MSARWIVSLAAVSCFVVGISLAQDQDEGPASRPAKTERVLKAEKAATDWATSFMSGDSKKMCALSGVPFALDGRKIIESKAELDEILVKATESKAERNRGKLVLSVETTLDRSEIQDGCLPNDFLVVRLTIGKDESKTEKADLCIRPSASGYVIVGLDD